MELAARVYIINAWTRLWVIILLISIFLIIWQSLSHLIQVVVLVKGAKTHGTYGLLSLEYHGLLLAHRRFVRAFTLLL